MAGRPCPTCAGQAGYSRITNAEMKPIIKNAVDHVYALLTLKSDAPKWRRRGVRISDSVRGTICRSVGRARHSGRAPGAI